MQAQAALINFTVTRSGLEDQLLGAVVRTERPDLEQLKSDLTKQQNDFKITLKKLEDGLLRQLSAAEGNFLGNVELVESLELNKRTAMEIEAKVAEAMITEQNINTARETYRPAAARASLLYFILNDLNKVRSFPYSCTRVEESVEWTDVLFISDQPDLSVFTGSFQRGLP